MVKTRTVAFEIAFEVTWDDSREGAHRNVMRNVREQVRSKDYPIAPVSCSAVGASATYGSYEIKRVR